jgi:hypothetical protein
MEILKVYLEVQYCEVNKGNNSTFNPRKLPKKEGKNKQK